MPSTKSTSKKKPSQPPRNKTSRSDELKDADLDKVSGGLRSFGGPRPGDPCVGGE